MKRFVCVVAAALAVVAPLALAQKQPIVVPAERIGKYWNVSGSSAEADVPNAGKNLYKPACAAVSFVITKDGTTSDIKIQRVVPDGDLGKVAASVASGLTFKAAGDNAGHDAVFTYMILPFNLPEPASKDAAELARVKAVRDEVMQACHLDPFTIKNR